MFGLISAGVSIVGGIVGGNAKKKQAQAAEQAERDRIAYDNKMAKEKYATREGIVRAQTMYKHSLLPKDAQNAVLSYSNEQAQLLSVKADMDAKQAKAESDTIVSAAAAGTVGQSVDLAVMQTEMNAASAKGNADFAMTTSMNNKLSNTLDQIQKTSVSLEMNATNAIGDLTLQDPNVVPNRSDGIMTSAVLGASVKAFGDYMSGLD